MPDFKPFVVVQDPSIRGQAMTGYVPEGVDPRRALDAGVQRYLAEVDHDEGFTWHDLAKVPSTYWTGAGIGSPAFAEVVVVDGTTWLQEPEERVLPAPPARPGAPA